MDYSDVVKQGSKRVFIQPGGPGPTNPVKYTGIDSQYLSFTGSKRPIRGGVDPINTADPLNPSQWIQVGQKTSAPGLPTGTLELQEKVGTLPISFDDLICPNSIYVTHGPCTDPSTFDYWSGYLEIWAAGLATDVDTKDRTSFENDDAVMDSISYTFRRAYAVGSLTVGEQAAATITREIIDVAIAPNRQCGDCGVTNNGFKWMYAIHKENSGVAAAQAAYSVDGGVTWTLQTITGMANTEIPSAIAVVGNLLVILSPTGQAATQSSYYYTTINQVTGVPSSSWTEVNTGFVVAGEARDMFVLSPREVFFVGDGGYIYKSTDIPSGVSVVSAGGVVATDLLRVTGSKEQVVAVGASGKVLVSNNRGVTFSVTTADPSANSNQAVGIRNVNEFWVGDGSGGLYYTVDGGASWTAKSLSGVTLAGVQDILWATPDVGYILATIAGPLGRVFATANGGYTFVNSANQNSRILNVPAALQRANRIAVPETGLSSKVNNVLIGGLGAATDGVVLIGSANPV